MWYKKNKDIPKTCIVCRKKPKRPGSLFCENCFKKDIFIKLKSFQESPEFKYGWAAGKGGSGRIPTREQREREIMQPDALKSYFKPFWRRSR